MQSYSAHLSLGKEEQVMDNSKKYKNSGGDYHPNRGWKRKFERDMKKMFG